MGGKYRTHDGNEKYIILARKFRKKRLSGRHRCRWENDIKMDLKEGCEFMD
jgi:hypothetical protein